MDEPTEHVVAFYREAGWSLRCSPAHRYAEVDAAMRPLLVVVAEVLPEDRSEVAPPEHQGPVEALGADGPHEPFGQRVRPRRADGSLDDFGTFRPEDLVETGGELRVPVPDEELDLMTGLGQVADQVTGDLGDKAVVRVVGTPRRWARLLACSMANKT